MRPIRALVPLVVSALALGAGVASAPAQAAPVADDTPTVLAQKGEHETGAEEQNFDKLRDAYYSTRLLSGDDQLTVAQAAALRSAAHTKAKGIPDATVKGPTRGGTWTSQGPNPIVQNMRTSNSFGAMSGRVGALAVRKNGSIILGAAQGGIWTYDEASKTWTSRSNDADTQSVGALAVAPSNDNIVYMGSGEGSLSGDAYYGDGVWKSTDGGLTWTHVSTQFTGQATSSIVVDPSNPDHLYAATLRGRGGNHRTTAPTAEKYGVWESTDGGSSWTLRKGTTDEFRGATDLVLDPAAPTHLWASFWGDGIYKSTDGGATWTSSLGNLPAGNFAAGATRFALGISHPAGAANPTLYTGYDYFDTADKYHGGAIWKSTDGGTTWANATGSTTGSNSVAGYCGTQCFYDNVVKPDPTNPDVVYVLGSYGYNNSPQSGGVYRSTNGGATWQNLGYDLHPDFHALAFQPTDTKHVVIGNDGGVWQSHTGGGRPAGTSLSAADWENLNGQVNPTTAALIHSTGLAITQFTSIATVPKVPGQYWGGTQDNGTLRKSTVNSRWFDQASGDGGQVIVDQTTPNPYSTSFPAFVFGSYYGISPYRYDPSKVNTFFGNEGIDGGINLNDRAEFYVPWVQNRGNTNQMFLGTYRLYRTDNAETAAAADVTWKPVSSDLTSGCTGTAPNGARGCLISAVGVADGGDGVWVGTDDARVWVSPDAVTAKNPTWTRVGASVLPNRPVDQIAVDRSNWRIAYLAYGGFGAATPSNTGHVFSTTDGGKTFTDVSSNLPDVPVNSVVIDPSDSRTIYVGTDVGTFVSTNGGHHYNKLGAGMPKVATWQLDYDATNGVLLAGTHGRGAYTLANRGASAALVVSKSDAGKPVGPGSTVDYTVTVKNIGNAAALNTTVTDTLPADTTFVSADQGGTVSSGVLTWSGLTVPAGGQVQLHFTVRISASLPSSVTSIVNDGITVTSRGGVDTTGSPHATPIAPAHAVSIAPAAQSGGAKVGSSASYHLTVTNDGYAADTFGVTAAGTWSAKVYDTTCTTPLATTPSVAGGGSTDVCVKVTAPSGASEGAKDETVVTAASTADPSVTATATLTTYAAATDTLLVDGDGNNPDVSARYKAALGSTPYGYWDLAADADLPQGYLTAHKNVVWWTGNSYPAPVSPYEGELKALLDGGGRLMLSGQDILDQAAGTTPFVKNYLHVSWDGTETQNDKATDTVSGVTGNPVSGTAGTVAIDHSVLGANFEDQVTPIDPATAAFKDASGATDALTVAASGYKVFFLAFPFEAYGSAGDRATLMSNTVGWFSQP
ncbi:MAG: hypothetical protein JWP82_2621 [Humibacillus sp.]|nr:hypothetical protein [Humibacillus sp.]